jgi:hypothetical protein
MTMIMTTTVAMIYIRFTSPTVINSTHKLGQYIYAESHAHNKYTLYISIHI